MTSAAGPRLGNSGISGSRSRYVSGRLRWPPSLRRDVGARRHRRPV